jgi:hypothetical protein
VTAWTLINLLWSAMLIIWSVALYFMRRLLDSEQRDLLKWHERQQHKERQL